MGGCSYVYTITYEKDAVKPGKSWYNNDSYYISAGSVFREAEQDTDRTVYIPRRDTMSKTWYNKAMELKEFIDMMGIYVDNEEEVATEAECEGVSERLVYLKGAGLPADQ